MSGARGMRGQIARDGAELDSRSWRGSAHPRRLGGKATITNALTFAGDTDIIRAALINLDSPLC